MLEEIPDQIVGYYTSKGRPPKPAGSIVRSFREYDQRAGNGTSLIRGNVNTIPQNNPYSNGPNLGVPGGPVRGNNQENYPTNPGEVKINYNVYKPPPPINNINLGTDGSLRDVAKPGYKDKSH